MEKTINLNEGNFIKKNMNSLNLFLKWVVLIILFIGSTVYLGLFPEQFTPVINVMFSIFLFLISYWIGYTQEIKKIIKVSNEKWLPQGESVIYRLLTLHSNVKIFAINTMHNCSKTCCDLPELQKEELKAIRIKFKSDCEANSLRLEDIAMQLEDAISDWQRFIEANCEGDECRRIFQAIYDRKNRLEDIITENAKQTPKSEITKEEI